MSFLVTVIYPVGHPFDLEYYLSKHMPLVQSRWGPNGLLEWEVITYQEGAPYQIGAILRFKDAEAFQKSAAGPHAAEVMGDVPNFTTAQPLLIPGEIKASAKI